MDENKTKMLVLSLVLVIVVLLGFIIYSVVIKPAMTGYVTSVQNEGVQSAIGLIMERAKTCQPVPLTSGDETMEIVSVESVNRALQQQAP